jgi:hypothetical protein
MVKGGKKKLPGLCGVGDASLCKNPGNGRFGLDFRG